MIEVDRCGILGWECEPDVVGRGYRPVYRMLVNVSDLEILEEPVWPTFF